MKTVTISKQQARKIILQAAGLAKAAQFGKGKEAVFKVIEHLGYIQIDTISVVERAHHHAIATRVPNYQHVWVDELQADARIFEFWAFAVSYIPMTAYRFSLPVKESFKIRYKPKTPAEIRLMQVALDRISREGPLMARDFENDRITKSSGWWDYKPSKLALERLYMYGDVMTIGRKSFQKVYDLPENIVPGEIDTTAPTDDEFSRYLIMRALQSLGIATVSEIVYHRGKKAVVQKVLNDMVEQGVVCVVEVTGVKSQPQYTLKKLLQKKITIGDNLFILSPFDVLNIYRHRLRNFFDFDYQIECFVPPAKRKYGYFSLPVLLGDKFIGRMDSKADRKTRTLIVNNMHLESKDVSDKVIKKFSEALKTFAVFNKCETIILKKSNSASFLKAVKKILS